MTGEVIKDGDKWMYRIYLGRIGGRSARKQRTGFKTKAMAESAMRAIMNDMEETGNIIVKRRISLEELYQEFLIEEGKNRRYTTLLKYDSVFRNHLMEPFKNEYIYTITPKKIKNLLESKEEAYSNEFINQIYNILLVLFDYAKEERYIKVNPMKKVKRPMVKEDFSGYVYSAEELALLRKHLVASKRLTPFLLGVYLGVRCGECYGLCWSDIDLEKNTVTIDKQLQRQNGVLCFAPTKTSNSVRTITFGRDLHNYLTQLKKEQAIFRKKKSDIYRNNTILDVRSKKPEVVFVKDLINIDEKGKVLAPDNRLIQRVAKKLAIPFKYHNLRHTHATRLLEMGCNPKYVQERLGHAELETTLKLYVHVTRKMEEQAAKLSDKMMDLECGNQPIHLQKVKDSEQNQNIVHIVNGENIVTSDLPYMEIELVDIDKREDE